MATLRIALPPTFDFDHAIGFLAARAVPAMERVSTDAYRRVVRVADDRIATLAVTRAHDALVAESMPRLPDATLRALVTRMFDLDADVDAFGELARGDALLGAVVAANPRGLRLPQLLDPFEGLVRAILGQQVSVAAATTMTDRVVRSVAERAGDDLLAFPRAAAVVALGTDRLRAIGLTGARTATLLGAARAVAEGALDLHALRERTSDEARDALLALSGVGPWTADYVRMRALGDRDAFPSGDLGVRKALARLGVTGREVDRAAERWRPWRAYATLHLWHSLSAPA